MKKILLTIALALLSTVAFSKTVTDYPNLTRVLGIAKQIASDGGTLEFFGWSEEKVKATTKCVPLNSKQMEDKFIELLKTVSEEVGDYQSVFSPYLESAHKEWIDLFSDDQYVLCTKVSSLDMSYARIYSITSKNYTFSYELGWED